MDSGEQTINARMILMETQEAPARKQEFLKIAGQILLVNLAATIVAIFLSGFPMDLQRTLSLKNLLSSFVYSNCIGTLIGLAVVFGVPRFLGDSTLVRFIKIPTIIFIATIIGVTIAETILSILGISSWNQVFPPPQENFVFSLIIAFIFGFSIFFYEFSQARLARTEEELRQKELAEANARALATEAQLASLESRIHPHFLFNTLNSIAALIRENPVLAEKMVEKLSALLRYSLDSNARSLVTLAQELKITRDYLEIEKVRFGDRLNYKIDTEEGFSETKLPPLALQTLVENSIKHVAARRSEETEICISVTDNKGFLKIEVRDSGKGFSEAEIKNGHGLENLQRRLETIFDNTAQLKITKNGAGGSVSLVIPANGQTS
jgi:sensor histidine kinase YesM